MHKITTEGPTYLLRVELRSYEGEFIFAEYSNFSVGPESDNYRLHVSGYLPNSTAGWYSQLFFVCIIYYSIVIRHMFIKSLITAVLFVIAIN